MTRPWTSTEVTNGEPAFTFARSASLPVDPVTVNLTVRMLPVRHPAA